MPLSTNKTKKQETPTYNPSNYQQGWGIGFGTPQGNQNIDYTNRDQLQNEIQRVNTVSQNRERYGMEDGGHQDYLNQLQAHLGAAPQGTSEVNMDSMRREAATMEDLANRYGFDFSREAAERQAEAEAQARRDGIESQRRGVQSNVESAGESLDRNYFQQMQQQMQNQTNSGLNAGIAADQDLRMAMSRQAEMGDIYRDRNQSLADLLAEEARIDPERLAREDSLHHDRLTDGFGMMQDYNAQRFSEDRDMIDRAMQQRGMNIDQENADREFGLQEGQLTGNYLNETARNYLQELMDLKEFNESGQGSSADRQANTERANELRGLLEMEGVDSSLMGSDVSLDEMRQQLSRAGATLDSRRMEQEQSQFEDRLELDRDQLDETIRSNRSREELARDQFERPYEELTQMEKFQVDLQRAQLDETIRSNRSREQLARDQFERPYSQLTAQQQEQINLAWAQQELAYEQFDRPYSQLTEAQRQQLDQTYAQMSFDAGTQGAHSGGTSGNPQAQMDRNTGNVRLPY